MNLESQIRRAFVSLTLIAGLAGVAFAQGEPAVTASVMDPYANATACATDAWPPVPAVSPVKVIKAEPSVAVQLDWRARMPATIARSRS